MDWGWNRSAVYSDADKASKHCEMADIIVPIRPAFAAKSYLNVQALLDASVAGGADGVGPRYD